MVQSAQSCPAAYMAATDHPRFEIHARPCPNILARVTGLFARLDLLPLDFRTRRSCGGMWMDAAIPTDFADVDRLAERLRAIIGVEAVLLIPAPRPAEPRAPVRAQPAAELVRAPTFPAARPALGRGPAPVRHVPRPVPMPHPG